MNERPTNPDDIDPLDFLAGFFLVVKKNLLLVTLCIAAGVILGVVYQNNATRQYTSRILFSTAMPETSCKIQIDRLQKLVAARSQLAQDILNLSADEVASIVRVKIESTTIRKFEVQRLDEKETGEEVIVLLQVKSFDNSIWPKFSSGLIRFMENSPFAMSQTEQQRKFYSQLITRLDTEIKDLELLKSKVLAGTVSSQGKEGIVLIDPTEINTGIIELTKERIEYQIKLENVGVIRVIEGFTVFDESTWPNWIVSVGAGILLGILTAAFLIVLKAILQRIRSSEKTIAAS